MNKNHYGEIRDLISEFPIVAKFDCFYLGFVHHLTPSLTIAEIFDQVKNVIELCSNELITAQEKATSFFKMFSKKTDPLILKKLRPQVDSTTEGGDYSLKSYFIQLAEIIPNYQYITQLEQFYIGQFHGMCPSYQIMKLLDSINNVNEILKDDNDNDESKQLDIHLKFLNKRINENTEKITVTLIKNDEKINGHQPKETNFSGEEDKITSEKKRKVEADGPSLDLDYKKVKKNGDLGPVEDNSNKIIAENLRRNGNKGDSRKQDDQGGKATNVDQSDDPFSDLRTEHLQQAPAVERKRRLVRADSGKSGLEEIDISEVEVVRLKELGRKKSNTFKRMTTAEEEALSRAFIEEIEREEKEREKLREKAKVEEDKPVNCSICLDDLYSSSFKPLERCPHVFHEECMKEYLKAKIDEKGFPIRCPELECKSEITVADVGDFIDKVYRDKFISFSFKSYLEKHASEVSCCPTADCSFAFVKEEKQVDLKCPVCKKHYCLNCRVKWHHGQSCKEYQVHHTKDENDVKFENFVKGKNYKQCPQCNFWVSKIEGCKAMSCRCGAEFCYSCGREGDGHDCSCGGDDGEDEEGSEDGDGGEYNDTWNNIPPPRRNYNNFNNAGYAQPKPLYNNGYNNDGLGYYTNGYNRFNNGYNGLNNNYNNGYNNGLNNGYNGYNNGLNNNIRMNPFNNNGLMNNNQRPYRNNQFDEDEDDENYDRWG